MRREQAVALIVLAFDRSDDAAFIAGYVWYICPIEKILHEIHHLHRIP